MIHAHFIRKKIKIEKENALPVATAAPRAIGSSPSDPDPTSHSVPAKKSNPAVKPKIPVNKSNPLVPTAASAAIESPPSDYDISSPVLVKKSNPRVIKPTPFLAAPAIKELPPVVIDISNDPKTESLTEEMELKSVVKITDVHQQPKEKVTGTKSKVQAKPTTPPVKDKKFQPIRPPKSAKIQK